MDAPAELAALDLATLGRFADTIRSQDGRGVRRRDLIRLAGTAGGSHAVTIEAGPDLPLPLLIVHRRPRPAGSALLAGLSPREREVAALLAEGLSNQAIARRLRISVGTVKDHVHRVLTVTGCQSRAAFVAAYLTGGARQPG
jgi:DNA-binding CsgD family transcriptional regulator